MTWIENHGYIIRLGPLGINNANNNLTPNDDIQYTIF